MRESSFLTQLTATLTSSAGSSRVRVWSTTLLLFGCLPVVALAQRDKVPKRSLPPAKFDEQTEDVFSGDASDRLRGERPAIGAGAAAGAVPVTDASEPSGVTSFAWSGLISASTIVDEIKVHRADLAKNVRNVRVFRSGGNIDTRLRFTVIAAMFGIAAEYDADVRWKRQASIRGCSP